KRPGRGRERRRLRIAAVSATFPGSVHDKKVFDRAGGSIPEGATGYGGTAYLGAGLQTPRRKPPKGQPTRRQRAGKRPGGGQRGRARDGEAEGVASRRGAVADPPPPAHPDDEERGRPAQPDVRRVTRATDQGRQPAGPRARPISQRVYCFDVTVDRDGLFVFSGQTVFRDGTSDPPTT